MRAACGTPAPSRSPRRPARNRTPAMVPVQPCHRLGEPWAPPAVSAQLGEGPRCRWALNVAARRCSDSTPLQAFESGVRASAASSRCPIGAVSDVLSAWSAASVVAPSRSTTQASGRSSPRSSGTATTDASTTSGWPMRTFSSSTDEIHSPPDLMTSSVRSVSWTKPFRRRSRRRRSAASRRGTSRAWLRGTTPT
jgi:hypothetical protein